MPPREAPTQRCPAPRQRAPAPSAPSKDGHDLPYQRGALVAAHIDLEMRKNSKNLADLVKEIWRESCEKGPFTPDEFFARVAEKTSPEFAAKAEAWALDGEVIPLPEDLFGESFTTKSEKDIKVYVSAD